MVYLVYQSLASLCQVLILILAWILGGIFYDIVHYYFHHGQDPKWGLLKSLKYAHMRHHFRDNSKEFGVTSIIWDLVYGTKF